jgi:hypothetical protein
MEEKSGRRIIVEVVMMGAEVVLGVVVVLGYDAPGCLFFVAAAVVVVGRVIVFVVVTVLAVSATTVTSVVVAEVETPKFGATNDFIGTAINCESVTAGIGVIKFLTGVSYRGDGEPKKWFRTLSGMSGLLS